ncbi:MAG: phage major capsid protein [Ectothiorhodospiraceae bacterium]|nr:phage major capsid protein [Ectothiorhodospiraceae bacterium]
MNEHRQHTSERSERIDDTIERIVQNTLEPYLAARRPFNPSDVSSTGSGEYRPLVNGYSDLLHSLYRGVPHQELVRKGLSTGSDPDGGVLVPTEHGAAIARYINEYGVARQECTVIPTTANTISLKTRDSGMTAYYTDEASQITKSKPQYSESVLVAKKLAVLSDPISSELMADAIVDMVQEIGIEAAEAIAYAEDQQVFNGTGSPFTGVLHHADVHDVTMQGAVEQINYDALNVIPYEINSQRLAGAKWYMHRSVMELITGLKDNDGRPLFRDAGYNKEATFLGYPFRLVEAMPAAEDVSAGESFMIFGNLRNVTIYDRQQISVKLLTEGTVDSVNLGETDQVAIRHIERHMITVRRPKSLVRLTLAA